MPKIIPKKVVKAEEHHEEEIKEKIEKTETKSEVLKAKRACGCCDVELAPLPPGQKYFEAPDGHVIIGEEKVSQVWDRRKKGAWINPLR